MNKRKATSSPPVKAKAKVVKQEDPPSTAWRFDPLKVLSADDHSPWPAPAQDMAAATAFIRRLLPASKSTASTSSEPPITLSEEHPLVLLPDKDADGLCSTQVMHRTLLHLGVAPSHIHIHHLSKATHVASASETEKIKALNPAAVIVLDQGSRPGPPLLGAGTPPVLVIDHHYLHPGEGGPQGSIMLNACHAKPVATASLLTWCICRPLWHEHDAPAAEAPTSSPIDWLAVLGTAGDLSVNVSWDPPWPDLAPEMKRWTKKRIGTAVALLNAPRRTPDFDVAVAYASLAAADDPLALLDPQKNSNAARLYAARSAVQNEAERCTHTPPRFAKDGRLAVLFINSRYQVHPGIATRWSGALRGAKKLQVVMCANTGYSPTGTHTHFSCRRAGAALKRGEDPNIIELLHDYAARDLDFLADVVKAEAEIAREAGHEDVGGGEEGKDESSDGGVKALNFARGHREASGGILPHALWQRFVELMEIGVPADPSEKASAPKGGASSAKPSQKTKLTSFFAPKGSPDGKAGPVKKEESATPVKKETTV